MPTEMVAGPGNSSWWYQRWLLATIVAWGLMVSGSNESLLNLINVSPLGLFSNSRRLRRGDPSSPLLFILVVRSWVRHWGELRKEISSRPWRWAPQQKFGYVFLTSYLLMIHFYFVMPTLNKFFILKWCWLVLKLVWLGTWKTGRYSLLQEWVFANDLYRYAFGDFFQTIPC